ncbi:MAG: outer membrane lipoprotein-sorting protein, partial [Methylococcaceae bacterium]|nr:outer membrane lipoprotein-sorting protein [Methylococcaceae bacterium]
MKIIQLTKLLMITILPIVYSNANSAGLPSGDSIAKNINARDEGIAVSRNLTMQMTDRHGKVRERETRAFRKYFGDEKRTAIFYLKPKNIKDTAFLTYDYADKQRDDDQWLYLPAMRK